MCAHYQTISPLADGRINNVLLQTVPDINEALPQLINTVYTTVLRVVIAAQHSRLHNPLD